MAKQFGYMGKILRVDLAEKKITDQELSKDLILNYVGGRGFGAKILYDEVNPRTNPFSPDNKIIFTTGPLSGTNAQCFGRWFATTISANGSYVRSGGGGNFAAELKFSGYDVVVIEGRADRPTYLWIKDGKSGIKDATHLWGLPTDEAQRILREENDPQAVVACIGPPGEKLVRFAAIMSDRRSAARGGVGAVMGSKNLKAIVVRGEKEVHLAKPKEFRDTVAEQIKFMSRDPKNEGLFKEFRKYGSPNIIGLINEYGIFPTRNWQEGVLEGYEDIDVHELQKYLVKHTGCYRCMVQCAPIVAVKQGRYAGYYTEGPEFQTIWAFGGATGNTKLDAIIASDHLCDKLGLDTISAGNVLGFAMKLYEKGIISKADTDGIALEFGNDEAMVTMIHKIAYRQGFGNILAEGATIAAKKIGKGAEKYAMCVRGLELSAYDPRGLKSKGLNYATATSGQHCVGWPTQEIFGFPVKADRLSIEGKGELTKSNQNRTAMYDTAILCLFSTAHYWVTPETLATLLVTATGVEEFNNPEYLAVIGERIWNLERLFNVRAGFTRREDTMPETLLKEPIPKGSSKGAVLELDQLLDQYYDARRWSKETGVPTRGKLKELGLAETIGQLEAERIEVQ